VNDINNSKFMRY